MSSPMRRYHQLVLAQRSHWRNDIYRLADRAQRTVVTHDLGNRVVLGIVLLPPNGPAAVIRMQNRDLRLHRCPSERRACLGKFLAELSDFGKQRDRRPVGSDDGTVILLLAV